MYLIVETQKEKQTFQLLNFMTGNGTCDLKHTLQNQVII